MKINRKECKCKRKVILLNYKWETFMLSKKLIRNLEKLEITIPSNKPLNEIKRYKLSISNPNIRERIVPSCLRHKCRRDCYEDRGLREVQPIKMKNKINTTKCIHSKNYKQKKLVHPELKYDDISPGSLSSYEDIEPLMSSTRTRMKELNEHWELLPRGTSTHLKTNKIGGSINSVDTLILGNDHEDPVKSQTRAFYSSPKREDKN